MATKCEHCGESYDERDYSSCPHCAAVQQAEDVLFGEVPALPQSAAEAPSPSTENLSPESATALPPVVEESGVDLSAMDEKVEHAAAPATKLGPAAAPATKLGPAAAPVTRLGPAAAPVTRLGPAAPATTKLVPPEEMAGQLAAEEPPEQPGAESIPRAAEDEVQDEAAPAAETPLAEFEAEEPAVAEEPTEEPSAEDLAQEEEEGEELSEEEPDGAAMEEGEELREEEEPVGTRSARMPPPAVPSRWPGRVGAGFVGALVGAAACFGGLWGTGLTGLPGGENPLKTVETVSGKLGVAPSANAMVDAVSGLRKRADTAEADKAAMSKARDEAVAGREAAEGMLKTAQLNLRTALDKQKDDALAIGTLTEERNKWQQTVTEVADRLKAKPEPGEMLGAVDRLLKPPVKESKPEEMVRDGLASLAANRYPEAIKVLTDPKTPAGPEVLTARGEALWKLYQEEKAGKLDKSDKQVQEAIELLKKAGTARALFFLGQIEERTGNRDAAMAIYKEGAGKFPKDSLFQGALDRLELLGPAARGTSAADPLPAAVALVVLLAGPEEEASEPEPATLFNAAVRLAREGKYDKAIEKLHEAEKVHQRRAADPKWRGRNLSPDQDDRQSVFPDCCAQLEAFWRLHEAMQKAGYKTEPLALRPDAAKLTEALQTALKDARKPAGEVGKERDALREALQEVAGRLDTKADKKDILDAIGKLKTAGPDDKKVKPLLDQAARVRKRLEDAGLRDANLDEAVARLLQERDEAAARAKELMGTADNLAKKLREAEGKPAVPRPAETNVVETARGLLDAGRLDEALRTLEKPAGKNSTTMAMEISSLVTQGQLHQATGAVPALALLGVARVTLPLAGAKQDVPPADLLALRGEVRWLLYLHEAAVQGHRPRRDAAEVKKAAEELTRAGSPQAVLLLGQIEEAANTPAQARAIYRKGLEDFKNDPLHKRLFQNALDRLETRPAEVVPGGGRQSAAPRPDAGALALLTVALQAPTEKPAENPPEEAGFDFFAAIKKADAGDYAEAVKLLDEASKKQLARAAFFPQRRLNPKSDPHAEMFSRCCAQMKAYWEMRALLARAGYQPPALKEPAAAQVQPLERLLADKEKSARGAAALVAALKADGLVTSEQPDPVKALELLRKRCRDDAETLKAIGEKLGTDPTRKAILGAIDRLLATTCQAALDLRDAAIGELAATGFVSPRQRDLVQGLREMSRAYQDATALNRKLEAARAEAQDARAKAEQERDRAASSAARAESACRVALAGRMKAEEDRERAIKERRIAEAARELAETEARDAEAGRARAEAARDKVEAERDAQTAAREEAEAESAGARQTLGAVAEKVHTGPDRTEVLAAVTRLLDHRPPEQMLPVWEKVLADPDNQSLAADALQDARKVLSRAAGTAEAGELRARAAYVRALALRNEGNVIEARAVLKEIVGEAPPTGGWRAEAWRRLQEVDFPPAYYLGRARTALAAGQRDAAVRILDQGLNEFPGDGRLLACRALARLGAGGGPLVEKARTDAAAAVAAGAAAEGHYAAGRVEEECAAWDAAARHYREALAAGLDNRDGGRCRLALARVLCAKHAASSGEPSLPAELEWALRAADEAARAGQGEGRLMRAHVYASRSQWDQALHEMAEYMKQQAPAAYAADLAQVLAGHPALNPLPLSRRTNSAVAAAHYLEGYRLYVDSRPADAEKSFREAVSNDDGDARYWYFLGLSQFRQGKPDLARESFLRGRKLENQHRPGREEVTRSLERVQGEARQVISQYRAEP